MYIRFIAGIVLVLAVVFVLGGFLLTLGIDETEQPILAEQTVPVEPLRLAPGPETTGEPVMLQDIIVLEQTRQVPVGVAPAMDTGDVDIDTAPLHQGSVLGLGSEATVSEAEPGALLGLEAAMLERTMGNPNAPVTIREFASLTCGHCANFKTQVFPELKERYIDTGQVYYIYTDFPLNAPALDASAVARCLPSDQYFRYIQFLFETQDEWAFGGNHRRMLVQNARLLGGEETLLQACLESYPLKEALIERMNEFRDGFDINSTPSFLFNGALVVRGAVSMNAMSQTIDRLIAEAELEAQSE